MTWFGRIVEWCLSFFPTPMPIGRIAFDRWAESVIRLAGVPDNRSTRAALATETMHLSAKDAARGKRFFARKIRKIAANEVCHAVFSEAQEDKRKQAREEAGNSIAGMIVQYPEWVTLYHSDKKADAETLFVNEFYLQTSLPPRQEINKVLLSVLAEQLTEKKSSEGTADAAPTESKEA